MRISSFRSVVLPAICWILLAMPAPSQQQMVSIPAGEFWMGSEDSDAFPYEKPRRRVYVDAFRVVCSVFWEK
jgi:formylglycine-generating enzyme required for sulfatase activity